jgi:hypothetical protein
MVTFNALKLGFKANNGHELKEEGGDLTPGGEGAATVARHGGVVARDRDCGSAMLQLEVGDGRGGPGLQLGQAVVGAPDGKVGRGGGFCRVHFLEGKAIFA